MSMDIRDVITRKELKKFIKVPFAIFKGNEYYVPPLIIDEMDTFDKKKNPAQWKYFSPTQHKRRHIYKKHIK